MLVELLWARVPFFIRWPGDEIGSGRDVERLTAHIDVLPTPVDLCGLGDSRGAYFVTVRRL